MLCATAESFSTAGAVNSTYFSSYHPYADHIQFLKDLQTQYPDRAEVVTAGSSLNGNAITGIHIFGSSGKGVKPAIVFHATVHAREWIGAMVRRASLPGALRFLTRVALFRRLLSTWHTPSWETMGRPRRSRPTSTNTTSTSFQLSTRMVRYLPR